MSSNDSDSKDPIVEASEWLESGCCYLEDYLNGIATKSSLGHLVALATAMEGDFADASDRLDIACRHNDNRHLKEIENLKRLESQLERDQWNMIYHERGKADCQSQLQMTREHLRSWLASLSASESNLAIAKAKEIQNLNNPPMGSPWGGMGLERMNRERQNEFARARRTQEEAVERAKSQVAIIRHNYSCIEERLEEEMGKFEPLRQSIILHKGQIEDARRSLAQGQKLIEELKSSLPKVKDLPTATKQLVKATEYQARMGAFASIRELVNAAINVTVKLGEVARSVPFLELDKDRLLAIENHKSNLEKNLESASNMINDMSEWS